MAAPDRRHGERADRKWDAIFGDADPARAARHRRDPRPCPIRRRIAFAPNTHEFVVRLLSSLPLGRPLARSHHRQRVSLLRPADGAARGGRRRGRAHRGRAVRDLPGALRGRGARAAGTISCSSARSSSTRRRRRRPRRARRGGSRPGDADRHRRLSRLHGAADRPVAASRRAPSTSPAATSTRWRARAPASCIARPAMRRARATPAGSRRSAR